MGGDLALIVDVYVAGDWFAINFDFVLGLNGDAMAVIVNLPYRRVRAHWMICVARAYDLAFLQPRIGIGKGITTLLLVFWPCVAMAVMRGVTGFVVSSIAGHPSQSSIRRLHESTYF